MGSEPNIYIALVMKSMYCYYIILKLMYTEGTKYLLFVSLTTRTDTKITTLQLHPHCEAYSFIVVSLFPPKH